MVKSLVLIILTLLVLSCTDAAVADWKAIGSRHHIRMFNGGVLVAEWYSTGKVLTMTESDGWQFMDEKTQQLVRVSGDVIIEVVK